MKAWFAELPILGQVGLGLLALVILVGVPIFLFLRLRNYLEWQNVKTLEIKERVGLKIEFIKTAAQILGGAFFLVTIYVAWQNLVVSQEKHKTDLFTRAIEQLGSEKLEVRLGGIYALERIARDSDKDHGPIMEVLTAFVRLHAPWPPKKAAETEEEPAASGKPAPGEKKPETKPAPEVKPRADIQAILTVLGRRARTYGKGESHPLDLRQTDLRGADLREAHLEGAILWAAHLENADLRKTHLEIANLREAHLERAFLGKAHLEGAVLDGAHLERAALAGAHLEGANLWYAHLEGAVLSGAKLAGADLRETKGLTKGQINSAIIDEKTKLPDHLKPADPDKAKPQ